MTEGKHPGGRPRKYQSVEAMQAMIDDYFNTVPSPRTVLGLALHLDLTWQGLLDYEKRDEFVEPIQKAKSRIEEETAARMLAGKGWGPGHIFVLKNNYGWKDKQEIEHSGNVSVHFDREDEGL